jgi:LPXTG-motif cell wall-anchored protein
VTLSSGLAALAIDDLTPGTHTIEAAYTPDNELRLASAGTLTYQVAQPADEPTTDPAEPTTSDAPAPAGQSDTVDLASTGTDIGGLVAVGVLALATGAVLMAVRRNRSKSS